MMGALLVRMRGWLAALGVGFVAGVVAILAGRKAGYTRAARRHAEMQKQKRKEAQDAVADLRGAGRDDLAQRLRDNDQRW